MQIILGNTAPVEAIRLDNKTDAIQRVPRPDLGDTETAFTFPEELPTSEILQTVESVFLSHHSDELPAWVESSDPIIAEALSQEFTRDDNECPIGRPIGWGKSPNKKSKNEEASKK